MESYIDPNDDLSKLLMSIGSISKGFGGQGQRMGETASFNVTFRPNADPEVIDYFLNVYGEHPEKINFFLPCSEIEKCISAPYTSFNASRTLIAQSDGRFFTYIANLDNPLNTAEPYLRNGVRCSDGKKIEHQQNLGFLGKPNVKMQMSGRMFVFIKELLEAGVFQTMVFKFHTTADRDMLRKRLCFIRDFASGINVPLTAIPMFLTKYKKTTSFIDQGGVPRRSEHFYLDLGLVHFIGTEEKHPFSAAFSAGTAVIREKDPDCREEPVTESSGPDDTDYEGTGDDDGCAEIQEKMSDMTEPESWNQKKSWKDCVFALTDEQQKFIKESVSACGSRYGIRPEFLDQYKDRNGMKVTDLSMEELVAQLKTADEYLLRIMHKELTVDKQTETKAKMRRWALITASLIREHKYANHQA